MCRGAEFLREAGRVRGISVGSRLWARRWGEDLCLALILEAIDQRDSQLLSVGPHSRWLAERIQLHSESGQSKLQSLSIACVDSKHSGAGPSVHWDRTHSAKMAAESTTDDE